MPPGELAWLTISTADLNALVFELNLMECFLTNMLKIYKITAEMQGGNLFFEIRPRGWSKAKKKFHEKLEMKVESYFFGF